jgi:hypothetical protein
MINSFELLKNEKNTITTLASKDGIEGFFGQEVLRFLSMAGTLLESFKLDNETVDERYITHILARSLIENYFHIIYILAKPEQTAERYNNLISSFKRDYGKLLNDPYLIRKDELEIADPSWCRLPKGLDISAMLAQLDNDDVDKNSYFIYRITSFDTHGKNLQNIFQTAFNKSICNFPNLNLEQQFEKMAMKYLKFLEFFQQRSALNANEDAPASR